MEPFTLVKNLNILCRSLFGAGNTLFHIITVIKPIISNPSCQSMRLCVCVCVSPNDCFKMKTVLICKYFVSAVKTSLSLWAYTWNVRKADYRRHHSGCEDTDKVNTHTHRLPQTANTQAHKHTQRAGGAWALSQAAKQITSRFDICRQADRGGRFVPAGREQRLNRSLARNFLPLLRDNEME